MLFKRSTHLTPRIDCALLFIFPIKEQKIKAAQKWLKLFPCATTQAGPKPNLYARQGWQHFNLMLHRVNLLTAFF